MQALLDAMNEVIDARLSELGLIEPATPATGKGKGKKAAAAPVEEEVEVTLDVLKEKLTELVEAQGKDAAIALLKKHKATTLSAIKPAKYQAFYDAIVAELGEGEGGGDAEELFG